MPCTAGGAGIEIGAAGGCDVAGGATAGLGGAATGLLSTAGAAGAAGFVGAGVAAGVCCLPIAFSTSPGLEI